MFYCLLLFCVFSFACAADPRPLRLNEIQWLGSHNSYHIPKAGADMSKMVPEWRYKQKSIKVQLEAGVRWIELDLHPNDAGDLQVFHLPTVDPDSSCNTLAECLGPVKTFSDANPNHIPIWVFLETSPSVKKATWDKAIAEVKAVIPENKWYTPNDMYNGDTHDDLTAAIKADGWPALSDVRGKIILVANRKTLFETLYVGAEGDAQRLKDVPFFPMHDKFAITSDDPDVIVFSVDPTDGFNLATAVKQHVGPKGPFLVRDSPDFTLAPDGVERTEEDIVLFYMDLLDVDDNLVLDFQEGRGFRDLMISKIGDDVDDTTIGTIFKTCGCIAGDECKVAPVAPSPWPTCKHQAGTNNVDGCSCKKSCGADVQTKGVGYIGALECAGNFLQQTLNQVLAPPGVSVATAEKRQTDSLAAGVHVLSTNYPAGVPDDTITYELKITAPRCNPVWKLEGCDDAKIETAEDIMVTKPDAGTTSGSQNGDTNSDGSGNGDTNGNNPTTPSPPGSNKPKVDGDGGANRLIPSIALLLALVTIFGLP
eukprot:TRINITY_DN66312_c11_g1_i2.p1 TRINITY_DN66312_c11_g1~~TRINITY_DN66312_c11_g1_i2.p1  ORF type:complete len:537 (+),score=64.91 TRINITY_DN66312_c11_g1_i2:27-1637(+)